MDVLDFVPFLGFIRNDEETISIMAQASVVIPQVCDILGISLSDSESDDEAENGQSSPSSSDAAEGEGAVQGSRRRPRSSSVLARLFSSHAKDEQSSTRKRVNSEGALNSVPGQSTATAMSSTDLVLPPKKRRVQAASQSQERIPPTSSSTNSSSSSASSSGAVTRSARDSPVGFEDPIRQKLRQDVDLFNDKIRQLAALEREKNRVLESLLAFSAALGGSDSGQEAENDSEENDSNQDDDSDDLDDEDPGEDHDLDEEEVEEEIETTEVVEEQIVTLDEVFHNAIEDN